MEIRKTEKKDLARVMEIYAHARQFMAEQGNYLQWGPTKWPPEEIVVQDIELGRGYVCTEGDHIVGVFYFHHGTAIDSTYDVIEDGEWSQDADYGVVHRIASDGTPGVGSFCIRWAIEQCGYLRMDTHADNVPMNNLLRKLGFKQCGIIHVIEDDMPRNAYDIIA